MPNITVVMNKDQALAALHALTTGSQNRSQQSRLVDIIDTVEAALTAGVTRHAVLSVLHTHYGFTLSMSGFEKALKKLRAQRRQHTHHVQCHNIELAEPSNAAINECSTHDHGLSLAFESPMDRKKKKRALEQELDQEIQDYIHGIQS